MNNAFTWIFICEMGLKLLALGPQKYCRVKMNLLDGSIVILSIVELIVQKNQEKGGSLTALRTVRIFRFFRVLRVTRILRVLKTMQLIIGVIGRSIR